MAGYSPLVAAIAAGLPQAASFSTIKKGAPGPARASLGFVFLPDGIRARSRHPRPEKTVRLRRDVVVILAQNAEGRKPVAGELNEAKVRALGLRGAGGREGVRGR